MSNSTTRNQLYLINLTTMQRVYIQYVPDAISIDSTSIMSEVIIMGKNTPDYHQVAGREEVRLTLDFHAVSSSRKDVLSKVNMIKSWRYRDGDKRPAPKIKLIFGEMFEDQQWVLKSVKPVFSNFDAARGFIPKQAYVDIVLALDVAHNLTWKDIQYGN